MGMASF